MKEHVEKPLQTGGQLNTFSQCQNNFLTQHAYRRMLVCDVFAAMQNNDVIKQKQRHTERENNKWYKNFR